MLHTESDPIVTTITGALANLGGDVTELIGWGLGVAAIILIASVGWHVIKRFVGN
jgi:hypothetical protein